MSANQKLSAADRLEIPASESFATLGVYSRVNAFPLRDACDLLLMANRDKPKALGDFGYVVDDSPQAKAKTKPTP